MSPPSPLPPPLPRRAPTDAAWSAPARLHGPPPRVTRRPIRDANQAPPAGKLLVVVSANFALFLLYVVTLWTVTSDPGGGLRLALPVLLVAFGFAVFAPLALGIAHRPEPPGRRRA